MIVLGRLIDIFSLAGLVTSQNSFPVYFSFVWLIELASFFPAFYTLLLSVNPLNNGSFTQQNLATTCKALCQAQGGYRKDKHLLPSEFTYHSSEPIRSEVSRWYHRSTKNISISLRTAKEVSERRWYLTWSLKKRTTLLHDQNKWDFTVRNKSILAVLLM